MGVHISQDSLQRQDLIKMAPNNSSGDRLFSNYSSKSNYEDGDDGDATGLEGILVTALLGAALALLLSFARIIYRC